MVMPFFLDTNVTTAFLLYVYLLFDWQSHVFTKWFPISLHNLTYSAWNHAPGRTPYLWNQLIISLCSSMPFWMQLPGTTMYQFGWNPLLFYPSPFLSVSPSSSICLIYWPCILWTTVWTMFPLRLSQGAIFISLDLDFLPVLLLL